MSLPGSYRSNWAHSKQITRSTVLPSCVARMPCRGLKHRAGSILPSIPLRNSDTTFLRASASLTVVLPTAFRSWNPVFSLSGWAKSIEYSSSSVAFWSTVRALSGSLLSADPAGPVARHTAVAANSPAGRSFMATSAEGNPPSRGGQSL